MIFQGYSRDFLAGACGVDFPAISREFHNFVAWCLRPDLCSILRNVPAAPSVP
ncbi:hypothetical protein Hanom_Chr08g00688391 [Helianthus anomalus]